MLDIKAIIENVFNSKITKFSERVSTCEVEFSISKINIPTYDDLNKFIKTISFNNKTQIKITNPDEDIISISNSNNNEFEYNNYFSKAEHDDYFDIEINIQKVIVDNQFIVYNYKSFTDDILDNSLFEIMAIFSNLLMNRDSIVLNILDESVFWSTKTIMVTSNSDSCFSESIRRTSRIEICKISSFFQSSGNFEILPEDFDIINNMIDNPYEEKFNQIKTILALCFISSISTVDSTHIKCVINGQRSITFDRGLEEVHNNKTLYNIYDWIFTDGNYVDKAVIARNIISLHCKYCSVLEIDSTIFTSISSNYEIYLKENVSQYLEAKTKVSEFISNIGNKTTESAYELLNDFKKNIVAVFSFILTVILVNMASEHPLENFLTKEITMIMELILVGSLAFFLISLIQSLSGLKRIRKSYDSLRDNYVGVFSPEEIREIFDEDKFYIDCKKQVKRNIVLFSIIWITVIIIAFTAIELTSSNPIIHPFFDSFFKNTKSVL